VKAMFSRQARTIRVSTRSATRTLPARIGMLAAVRHAGDGNPGFTGRFLHASACLPLTWTRSGGALSENVRDAGHIAGSVEPAFQGREVGARVDARVVVLVRRELSARKHPAQKGACRGQLTCAGRLEAVAVQSAGTRCTSRLGPGRE